MSSTGYLRADLAGGRSLDLQSKDASFASTGAQGGALHSMQRMHSRQQTLQPGMLQDRQAKEHNLSLLHNNGLLKHTRLYYKILVLEATLLCGTGGAEF